MRLALAIGIILPFFSQISGVNVIIYYGPTVLKTAGLGESAALSWQILFGAVCSIATLAAILTVDKLGRKPLLLSGIAGVGAMLALSGALMGCENVPPRLLVAVFAVYLGVLQLLVRLGMLDRRVRDISHGHPRPGDVDLDLLAVDGLYVGGSNVPLAAESRRPNVYLLALRPDNPDSILVCLVLGA